MFAARFFAPRYFAPRYFAETGAAGGGGGLPISVAYYHMKMQESI